MVVGLGKRISFLTFVTVLLGALLTAPSLFAHGDETEAVTVVVTMEPILRFAVDTDQEGVEIVSEEPLVFRIQPGTQVVFRNNSTFGHNVLHATPENLHQIHGQSAFHSPEEMAPDETFSYTFEREGTYPILCMHDNHHLAGMTATILVGDDPPSAAETFAAYASGGQEDEGHHGEDAGDHHHGHEEDHMH